MNAVLEAIPVDTASIGDVILVRYALANATPRKVRDDVGKLCNGESIAAARDELVSSGLLSKGKRNAVRLTDTGRERVLQFLGLTELPDGLSWGSVITKYLFPKAARLSAEAASMLDKGDKLAVYLLKTKYELADGAGSTVKQIMEAIACKELGYPQEMTLAGLMRKKLSNLLGEAERVLTTDELAAQLPRFGTGLKSSSADEVRRAIIRDWLSGTAPKESPSDRPDDTNGAPAGDIARPDHEPQVEPFDLAAFASTVLAFAARSPAEDRFHDNKVFIAPLWRASQQEPNFPQMSLRKFKHRLVEANGQHLLHLSRADLVHAMDSQLVAESETAYLNATYHFVLLEEARP